MGVSDAEVCIGQNGVRRGNMMAGHNKDNNKTEKYAQNYSAMKI